MFFTVTRSAPQPLAKPFLLLQPIRDLSAVKNYQGDRIGEAKSLRTEFIVVHCKAIIFCQIFGKSLFWLFIACDGTGRRREMKTKIPLDSFLNPQREQQQWWKI
jgi:hypothetical protein